MEKQERTDLARLIASLPIGVAHSVAFTLADSISLDCQARGTRVLELADVFPRYRAELASLAVRVGFDSQLTTRRLARLTA